MKIKNILNRDMEIPHIAASSPHLPEPRNIINKTGSSSRNGRNNSRIVVIVINIIMKGWLISFLLFGGEILILICFLSAFSVVFSFPSHPPPTPSPSPIHAARKRFTNGRKKNENKRQVEFPTPVQHVSFSFFLLCVCVGGVFMVWKYMYVSV